MNYVLHVGIMLAVLKVFIILFLLILFPSENRKHPGSFENKSVSSVFN